MTWIIPVTPAENPPSDSHADEFFGGKKKVKPVQFLREVLQNSLDAQSGDGESVWVSFDWKDFDEQQSDQLRELLLQPEYWNHLDRVAKERPNPAEAKRIIDRCRSGKMSILIVEDSGTKGLCGPIDSNVLVDGQLNDLTCFLRLHGKSGKTGGMLGTFGVGRIVLFMASELTTFFAMSTPEQSSRVKLVPGGDPVADPIDSKALFFGMSWQNICTQIDPVTGAPIWFDNYQSFLDKEGGSTIRGLYPPFLDTEGGFEAGSVAKVLGFEARPHASGLSVAIPFPRKELTPEAMLRSIISEYTLPILRDDLSIRLKGRDVQSKNIAARSVEDLGPDEARYVDFMKGFVDTDSSDMDFDMGVMWRDSDNSLKEVLFEDDNMEEVAKRLRDGEQIFVELRLDIPNNNEDLKSEIVRISLEKTGTDCRGRRVTQRGNLCINSRPFTTTNYTQEYNQLTWVDAKSKLGELLGRSEGPAHDKWKAESIDEECPDAARLIRFLTNVGKNIHDLLVSNASETDRSIFADILPKPGSGGRMTTGGVGGVGGDRARREQPPSSPQDFDVDECQLSGRRGIRIKPGTVKLRRGSNVRVEFAYEGTRGRAWLPTDFDLNELSDSLIKANGGDLVSKMNRTINFKVQDPDGFNIVLDAELFKGDTDLVVSAFTVGGS